MTHRGLQRAYIEARYSEHFEITIEELDYLAGEVVKLKEVVARVCQERIDASQADSEL
ncbi:hypothetical protein [Vibrio quintilis]|uniref:hypothetical protein n=1 Tax=Vibrio quintilis TaxID=1117707 RepID=UPI0013563D79|nr:hypothetical protein [Vibrio quintilis]